MYVGVKTFNIYTIYIPITYLLQTMMNDIHNCVLFILFAIQCNRSWQSLKLPAIEYLTLGLSRGMNGLPPGVTLAYCYSEE